MFRQIILAATIAVSTGGADAAVAPVGAVSWGADVEQFATQPRAPWQADDPADSLYKAAREQLNRGDYRTAAKSFALIVERYPKSTYAGDALYWQAYAYYSIGEPSQLREALRVLDEQRRRYPKAATRGDADALSVRVKGTLARQGDAQSAEDISKIAKGTTEQCSRSGDDDDDQRMAALNALLQMNAESAVPILKQVLAKRDACSAGLREKAVFLLSQKRTPETEDIMLGVVKNDPSREVRKKAVFWLGQVNTDKAAEALVQMLSSSAVDDEMKRAGRVRHHAAAFGARPGRRACDGRGSEGTGGRAREGGVLARPAEVAGERNLPARTVRQARRRAGREQRGVDPEEDPLLPVADARPGEREVADGGRGRSQAAPSRRASRRSSARDRRG